MGGETAPSQEVSTGDAQLRGRGGWGWARAEARGRGCEAGVRARCARVVRAHDARRLVVLRVEGAQEGVREGRGHGDALGWVPLQAGLQEVQRVGVGLRARAAEDLAPGLSEGRGRG